MECKVTCFERVLHYVKHSLKGKDKRRHKSKPRIQF